MAIEIKMPALRDCACSYETRMVGYLTTTWKLTEPLYQLEKSGGRVACEVVRRCTRRSPVRLPSRITR